MGTYSDIIAKRKKDWNCESLMDGALAKRGKKLPFSSPLLNYSTYGGIPRGQITEFFGDPGGGKAQPLYSKVLTPDGFKRMGDIKIGDVVFDGCGDLCHVDGVYPQGKRKIYEITLTGNNKIRVADNHLNSVWWYNKRKKIREDFVWETTELIEQFNKYKGKRGIRFDIPSVEFEYKEVPLEPYLIGALLSDGGLSDRKNIGFTNPEKDIAEKVNKIINKYGYELVNYSNSCEYQYYFRIVKDKFKHSNTRSYIQSVIDDLDLWKKSVDKHIPEIYLYNSRDVRLSLLQGMFDGDGYISKDGKVSYYTSSKQLSDDFAFLVRSLGIRDSVSIHYGRYKDSDGVVHECHNSYRHHLKIPNGLEFYTSEKHRNRYRDRQHKPLRKILNIEYIGEEECQCIHVDSERHTYISDDFIPTHNTSTAIDICKNTIEIFEQEYDEEILKLRESVENGNKGDAVLLDDLMERGPKKVLYIDLEHSFDYDWSVTLGIENSKIDVMQPPDRPAEEILQMVQEIIETGELGLIVLDSIPSLTTQQELDKKFGERTVASLAGLLTVFFRKIVPILKRYDTTLLVVNQVRDNLENPYVINTPGGKALKFYCSLRMLFRIGSPVDFLGNELPNNTENPAGHIVTAKIVKQKSAPWDRKNGSYYLMSHSGIRVDMDFAQLAVKKYGCIKKSGAWYNICDPYTGEYLEDLDGKVIKLHGFSKVFDFLQENQEYYSTLKKYILDDINGNSDDDEQEEI